MTAQPEDNDTPDMTPEEAAEFEKAFLDWVLIGECKAEIHELKNLKPTTITERMQANQELEKLKAKLAERLEHVTDLAGHEAKSAPQPVPAAPPEAVLMPPQAVQSPLDTPAPELTPATPAHVVKPKTKRRTWRDVSAHYIVEVMRAGQYATAKELYRALEAKAGPNSPFNKGTGDNRGSLFVREMSQSLSMKTVQNDWQNLLIQARK